jgi:hypothetical protein
VERAAPGYPRSKYEAELDLSYAVALAAIHCRLFRNIERSVGWLNLFAGSGAVVTVINGFPHVAIGCGVLTAALSAYDLYFKPGKTAEAHERDKRAFIKLQSRSSSLTYIKLDEGMARIRADAAPALEVLERPVYNDNLRTHGRNEYLLPLSRWERFVRRLA